MIPYNWRRFFGAPFCLLYLVILASPTPADHLRDLQSQAIEEGHADWGYWGTDPEKYTGWSTHSNRLIPVYTFGLNLKTVAGERSVYRDAARLAELYGRMPDNTLNPAAEYFDQTDIARLQLAAAAAGKKYIILIVFDGMDWQTTRAAATYNSGKVAYDAGRGTGLHMLDYRGTSTDFGFFVTSPASDASAIDVDAQTVLSVGGKVPGGYNATHGGPNPWTPGDEPGYLIGKMPRLSACRDRFGRFGHQPVRGDQDLQRQHQCRSRGPAGAHGHPRVATKRAFDRRSDQRADQPRHARMRIRP